MGVGSGDILVVTEAGTTEAGIVSSLTNSGFSVHVVTAASHCLPSIKQHSPRAILLSAVSNSIDPMKLLRSIRKKYDTPVIVLVEESHAGEIVPLLKQGADNYISIPASDSELLTYIVNQAINLKQERLQQTEMGIRLRELELDQIAGHRVQSSSLPDSPASLGSFVFSHHINPSLILSGDSVDYFPLPDGKVLFYLADVSGHGAAGAIVSVMLTGLSRRLEREFADLGIENSAAVLLWYNCELLRLNLEQHVTMFLGILDAANNTLQYSNAAHFPAAILEQQNQSIFLELGGFPLGMCETEYECSEVKIEENFNLVMFSDGVLEIIDQDTIRDKETELLSLVQCGKTDIDALVKHLGLDRQMDVPDDIAVFTVARKN
ncbi:MAG: fused response regulator/phosphatase [bacterium]|nr:response regulator [Gammaproteobacteria bacterium]HIL94300.1 response regulator [Pseudomonadales bacterium]